MEEWKKNGLHIISKTIRLSDFIYVQELPGVLQRIHSLSLYILKDHQEFAEFEIQALSDNFEKLRDRYRRSEGVEG